MLFKSLATATLAGVALAQPLHQHHQHENEKRAVKVVTKTNRVTVTLGAGDVTTTWSSVSLSTPSTSVSVNTDTTIIPQNQPSTTLSTSSTKATSTETASTASSDSESSSVAASGKGITYSPYSASGGCKSASEIASEISQLSDYDIIRIYGVDCDQASAVLSAKADNQKIFAGIYDMSAIEDGVATLAEAVEANGGWDIIHTVSVGNELVNSGSATVSQVAGYVKTARAALESAGYTGPVVTTDTFIAVINNPELCDVGDYAAVNAHAFFDGYVTAEQAGDWVLLQIQRVWSACGGEKSVFVTETGWPSKGETNGVAVPSKANQKAAVESISNTVGNSAILFNAFNDLWKDDGAYSAEKYWGIYSS